MSKTASPTPLGARTASPVDKRIDHYAGAPGVAIARSPLDRPPLIGKFQPSSLGRSYVTPESSVSPGLLPKEMQPTSSTSSGADDLELDGVDDDDQDEELKEDISDEALAELDPVTAPSTLADTYLPAVFAQHGPCAIRHLTQYLCLSNVKFGQLPLGKQRKLVVKALELKKGTMFEKVGWGRWNAIESRSSVAFTPESMPVRKPGSGHGSSLRSTVPGMPQRGLDDYPQKSSYPQHEFLFSPSLSVEGHEPREDDVDVDPLDLDMDDDSATDEEDWKAMGPQALRNRSPAIGSYHGSQPASFSGSPRNVGAYPIRRKSGAGIYQMKSPAVHPYSVGSYSKSPGVPRPSFPKSSSYLKSAPINSRSSSFSTIREGTGERLRDTENAPSVTKSDAEAIAALCMLSGGLDERQT